MDEKKPMSLAAALGGVRERINAKGRQPIGAEPMSAVANVRAMPSQATRWKHVVETVGYRSTNVFLCDGADLYADLLEALAPAALASGVPLRDYVRAALVQAGIFAAPKETYTADRSRREASATVADRCLIWANDPARKSSIEACAKAATEATRKPGDFEWSPAEDPGGFSAGSRTIDVAAAGQILFGEYDNAKIAEPAFVAAVLAEARKYTALASGKRDQEAK